MKSETREHVVVHVVEDGGPLTKTSRMTLAEAVEFYDHATERHIGQGGAWICRVVHDADSQFPTEDLLRTPSPTVEVEALRELGDFVDTIAEDFPFDANVARWSAKLRDIHAALTQPSTEPAEERRALRIPLDFLLSDKPLRRSTDRRASPTEHEKGCYDCGRPYGEEHGFPDLVIPDYIWNDLVSPRGDEGGLLCPSCMCKRAHEADVECLAVFRSGPFFEENPATPKSLAGNSVASSEGSNPATTEPAEERREAGQ